MSIRGFCYFNSVAIAAKQLQHKLSVSKILIVDWVRWLVNSGLMLFALVLQLYPTYLEHVCDT